MKPRKIIDGIPKALHPALVAFWGIDWRQQPAELMSLYKKWYHRTIDIAIRLALLWATAWVAFIIWLHFFDGMWFVYLHTYTGDRFSNLAPEDARIISDILSQDHMVLSFYICRDTLIGLLLTGVVVQFFPIRRFFYDGRGIINHILWIAGAAGLIALAQYYRGYEDFKPGFFLAMIPCAFLIDVSFRFSARFFPEMFDMFSFFWSVAVRLSRSAIILLNPEQRRERVR